MYQGGASTSSAVRGREEEASDDALRALLSGMNNWLPKGLERGKRITDAAHGWCTTATSSAPTGAGRTSSRRMWLRRVT